MLTQLPPEIRKDVRNLNCLIEGGTEGLGLHSIEEKFSRIDALRHHIGDSVTSILLKEDSEKIQYFLNNK